MQETCASQRVGEVGVENPTVKVIEKRKLSVRQRGEERRCIRKTLQSKCLQADGAVKMPTGPNLPPIELRYLKLNPQHASSFPVGYNPREWECPRPTLDQCNMVFPSPLFMSLLWVPLLHLFCGSLPSLHSSPESYLLIGAATVTKS